MKRKRETKQSHYVLMKKRKLPRTGDEDGGEEEASLF